MLHSKTILSCQTGESCSASAFPYFEVDAELRVIVVLIYCKANLIAFGVNIWSILFAFDVHIWSYFVNDPKHSTFQMKNGCLGGHFFDLRF